MEFFQFMGEMGSTAPKAFGAVIRRALAANMKARLHARLRNIHLCQK